MNAILAAYALGCREFDAGTPCSAPAPSAAESPEAMARAIMHGLGYAHQREAGAYGFSPTGAWYAREEYSHTVLSDALVEACDVYFRSLAGDCGTSPVATIHALVCLMVRIDDNLPESHVFAQALRVVRGMTDAVDETYIQKV